MTRNVYSYSSVLPIYALACEDVIDNNGSFDIALGTYITEYINKIEIIRFAPSADAIYLRASLPHRYPPTKLLFSPNALLFDSISLLASSGEYVRLWSVPKVDDHVDKSGKEDSKLRCRFKSGSDSDNCSPFTSIDWSRVNVNLLAGSTVNSCCLLFDVHKEMTQASFFLSPQENGSKVECYDVSFSHHNPYILSTACSDGTIKLVDCRTGSFVTSFRPHASQNPIIRVEFNPMRPNLLAAVSDEYGTQNDVHICELRKISSSSAGLTSSISNLRRHAGPVNAISWAPHKDSFLCSGSDDNSTLIWAVAQNVSQSNDKPLLAYNASSAVNNVIWPRADPDRICIAFGQELQLLKV